MKKHYFILLISVLFVISGCATTYKHEPIEMKVIDADTHEPLEGVIAVAIWTLSMGTVGGNVEVGTLQVLEAVSDNNGRIFFPAWGPLSPKKGLLDYRGAQINLFKPGYLVARYSNPIDGEHAGWRAEHPDRSPHDGATVKLRIESDFSKYIDRILFYDRDLNEVREGENCEWQKIPLTLVELHKLSKELDQRGFKVEGWQFGNRIQRLSDIYGEPHCASPEKFFEAYLK